MCGGLLVSKFRLSYVSWIEEGLNCNSQFIAFDADALSSKWNFFGIKI